MIKVRIWRWGDYSGYPSRPNVIALGKKRHRDEDSHDMMMERESEGRGREREIEIF